MQEYSCVCVCVCVCLCVCECVKFKYIIVYINSSDIAYDIGEISSSYNSTNCQALIDHTDTIFKHSHTSDFRINSEISIYLDFIILDSVYSLGIDKHI